MRAISFRLKAELHANSRQYSELAGWDELFLPDTGSFYILPSALSNSHKIILAIVTSLPVETCGRLPSSGSQTRVILYKFSLLVFTGCELLIVSESTA